MVGGNATPATIILWTKGLQKVHLRTSPEQHPFPGAPHQPTELRGPSVSSTCTALYNYPPLVDLPESCQTCLLACRARFSLTNLTLWPLFGLRKRFPYRDFCCCISVICTRYFLFSCLSFFPSTGGSRFQVGGVLGGKLRVLVLEKFLVFYGHTFQIYFTGFDLVSVLCLFFDLTSFWTSS